MIWLIENNIYNILKIYININFAKECKIRLEFILFLILLTESHLGPLYRGPRSFFINKTFLKSM